MMTTNNEHMLGLPSLSFAVVPTLTTNTPNALGYLDLDTIA